MARNKEGVVELYLRGQMLAVGGAARKFVSPGHNGVTDQITIWPGGHVHMVETKTRVGRVSAHQEREHARMRKLGVPVHVLHTKEAVDCYIEHYRKEYYGFPSVSRV